AVYGALAGAGVDIIPEHLRLEANGGYFDRGTNPLFFGTTVGPMGQTFTDFPVATYGGTMQISAFKGISPTQSADFKLYTNDPMVTATRYFTRPSYNPGFNWLASAEFTGLGTTLQDVARPNSTTTQFAYAGDVNLRAQFGKVRLRGDFETRSLSYILINQPSLVPYQDFPAGSQVGSELFGVLGIDYFWERIGFTGGVSVGMERPATFTPPGTLPSPLTGNTGGTLNTAATIVVRNEGDISILPATDSAGRALHEVPIFAAKTELREDFLEWFAVILQVYYQNDGNQTHLVKAPDGTSLRQFNHPNQLGFNLTLSARY
ncbi:MAG: hypothetical protein ACXVDD_03770, partial [Polyangia bacterium]